MKKIIVCAILSMVVLSGPVMAMAGYFKPIDIKKPQMSVGTFNDYKGNYAPGIVLALFTHEAGGGFEGWTPLCIGGTTGKGLGGPSVSLGAGMNLLPSVEAIGLLFLDFFTKPEQFTNLKEVLTPPAAGNPDLTVFVGPQYSLVFQSLQHYKTMSTWFVGGTLRWGGK